jgi:hypothetical protein
MFQLNDQSLITNTEEEIYEKILDKNFKSIRALMLEYCRSLEKEDTYDSV